MSTGPQRCVNVLLKESLAADRRLECIVPKQAQYECDPSSFNCFTPCKLVFSGSQHFINAPTVAIITTETLKNELASLVFVRDIYLQCNKHERGCKQTCYPCGI